MLVVCHDQRRTLRGCALVPVSRAQGRPVPSYSYSTYQYLAILSYKQLYFALLPSTSLYVTIPSNPHRYPKAPILGLYLALLPATKQVRSPGSANHIIPVMPTLSIRTRRSKRFRASFVVSRASSIPEIWLQMSAMYLYLYTYIYNYMDVWGGKRDLILIQGCCMLLCFQPFAV